MIALTQDLKLCDDGPSTPECGPERRPPIGVRVFPGCCTCQRSDGYVSPLRQENVVTRRAGTSGLRSARRCWC